MKNAGSLSCVPVLISSVDNIEFDVVVIAPVSAHGYPPPMFPIAVINPVGKMSEEDVPPCVLIASAH